MNDHDLMSLIFEKKNVSGRSSGDAQGDSLVTGMAAAPALALVGSGREERRRLDGHLGDEWSIFRRQGREILRRARDPEGCVRRLR